LAQDRHIAAHGAPSSAVSLDLQQAALTLTRAARDMTVFAFDFAGTNAVMRSDPLQRCLRDIFAGLKHVAFTPGIHTRIGRGASNFASGWVAPLHGSPRKDRSPRDSRHSIASAKWASPCEAVKFDSSQEVREGANAQLQKPRSSGRRTPSLSFKHAAGGRPILLIDGGPIGSAPIKAMHPLAFVLTQRFRLDRRREHVVDQRVFRR
jgi:hypothetical protein